MLTLTYGFKQPETGDLGSVWFPAMEFNIARLDAHDHDGTDSPQLTNSAIASGAAIAYSKLALTGSIVNADISGSAAVAYSKLALTGSIVNADVGASAAIAYSKLALTGAILNADINASAAIAYSKLALTGSIVNADISGSAAIAYSKLALTGAILNADLAGSIAYSKLTLTGSIVNADIGASAAIAFSKLASLTAAHILVGSAGNVATDVAVTGDITMSNAGVVDIATGVIVNADINASAAIAYSKLALTGAILNADLAGSIAASKLVGTDIATVGTITSGTWSATAIAVAKGGTNITSYTAGDLVYASGSTTLSKLGIGTAGQVLRTNGGATAPEWATLTSSSAVAVKAGNYPITSNDDFLTGDSDSAAFTFTLPDNAANTGKVYKIKKVGTGFVNAVTIARAGSDTIFTTVSGQTSTTLITPGEEIEIVSLGTGVWQVVNRRIPSLWIAYTPTGSWSSNTTYTGFWRRVGDSVEVSVQVATTGTPTTATLTVNLPTGITIDTSKLAGGTSATQRHLGQAMVYDASAPQYYVCVVGYSSTSAVAVYDTDDVAGGVGAAFAVEQNGASSVPQAANFANGDFVHAKFSVPVSGWNG